MIKGRYVCRNSVKLQIFCCRRYQQHFSTNRKRCFIINRLNVKYSQFENQQSQLEAEVENLSWKVERTEITDRWVRLDQDERSSKLN